MGVRPPSDDDLDDEPDTVEFGIAALDAHLDRADLSFPASEEEIIDALGDPKIDYDPRGRDVRLSKVLDRVEPNEFESRQELLDSTHYEFERRRQQGGGPLAWLRSLFPG